MNNNYYINIYTKLALAISHARSLKLRLLSFSLMLLAATSATPRQQKQNSETAPQISVRLAIPRTTFTVGQPIAIRVHIVNVGSNPVLVPNNLSMSRNSDSHIHFELRDDHGRTSPSLEIIADRISPRVEAQPAVALMRSWLLLYP